MEKIIAAIIVTFNGEGYVENCINSILNGNVVPHIIVVDNNSSDQTRQLLLNKFESIDFILLDKNYGFGYANNVGIEHALIKFRPDYYILLNQDTIVDRDTISNLISLFNKFPNYGIISPLHLNSLNALDRNFKTYIETNAKYVSDQLINNFDEIYNVQMINAAAWCIEKNCILKVGGFDTSLFFHYGEDVNYCQRVLFHGFLIGFTPFSKIVHYRSNELKHLDSIELLNRIIRNKRVAIANVMISDNKSIFLYYKFLVSIILVFIKSLASLNFKKLRFLKSKFNNGEILYKRKLLISRNRNRVSGITWLNRTI